MVYSFACNGSIYSYPTGRSSQNISGFLTTIGKSINNLKDMIFGYTPTSKEGEFSVSYYTSWDRTMYGRREKGVEFTGTNAALWACCAGVYLATMGPKGMEEVGTTILQRSQYAAKKISEIPGIEIKFNTPFFQHFVVDFNTTGLTVAEINKRLLGFKVLGGKDLSGEFEELGQCAAYSVTEVHTKDDIDKLVSALSEVIKG